MVTRNGYAPTLAGKLNKYRVAFSPEGEEAVFVRRPGSVWEVASSAWQDALAFFGLADVRQRVTQGGGSWVTYTAA